jgi:TonB-linked SusC/RagA family outer membrane protein
MKLLYKGVVQMLVFMCISVTTFAQTQVSGRVTGTKDDAPAAGVTVMVKGTRTAVKTTPEGTYTISAPATGTLVFTSVNFTRKEVPVNGQTVLNVSLVSQTTNMDEVVVVGYGTQRKKEVTGTISRVSGTQAAATAAPSFEAGLQGRVAGVQVSTASGLAGAGSYVRIRGIASVSAGGDPLYVIDGIPVSSDPLANESNGGSNSYKLRSGFTQSPLASINPDDIESIDVLKDAGAAGIYGSRGANGVILITTKRGKLGKPRFNFATKVGFVQPTIKPDLLNSAEWLQARQEAYENDGHTGQAPLPGGIPYAQAAATNTDWFDLLTQTGVTQDYNLSMNYGTKKFKSYVGGTYGSDESYAIGNKFDRKGVRANLDYTFNRFFKVILNSSYSTGTNFRVPTGWAGGIGSALNDALPIYAPYNADGSYNITNPANPLIPIMEDKFRSLDKRLLGGLTLIATPIKNLDLKATGNIDNLKNITDQFHNAQIYGVSNNNTAERWNTDIKNYNATATATYRYELNKQNIFTFLAGGEYQRTNTETKHFQIDSKYIHSAFYQDEDMLDSTNTKVDYHNNFPGTSHKDSLTADKVSFISYFGRINYAYKNKIFLQALARVDGSSKFGSNNKYGFFPAVSAGYVLSDEAFMKNAVPFLNYLKLRSSYGITGNASIGSFKYLDNFNYSAGNGNAPYNGAATLAQTQVKNADLQWETATNYDAGIEFGFLKNRISGDIGYYNKKSKDVLLEVALYEGYGIGSGKSVFRNFGKVTNEGVELSLNVKIIDKKDMTLSVFGNAARNRNEVTDVGGYAPDAIKSGTNESRVLVGYPLGTIYTIPFVGVDPTDGLPMYLDANNKVTKVYPDLSTSRKPVGKVTPDWVGGFGTNFKFRGLEINTLFAYSTGLSIWDNSGKNQFLGTSGNGVNIRREFLDRWTKPGDVAMYPKFVYDQLYPGVSNSSSFSSSLFLYKANYLRLRELTLAYNLNAFGKKSRISNMRFFITGTNLFVWTKYKGGDPEVNRDSEGGPDRNLSPNTVYFTAPQARTIQTGISVNF